MKYENFITDKYKDQDVHIVASGASLFGFDYSKITGNIITVNHSHKSINSDYTVFIDKSFPIREDSSVLKKTCISRYNADFPNIIDTKFINYFSYKISDGCYSGNSSGIAAITTALQAGAKKVFLHGFDSRGFNRDEMIEICEYNNYDTLNIVHDYYLHSTQGFFNHSKNLESNEIIFRNMIEKFSLLPKEKIFNCSQFSAIPFFERIKL